MYPIYFNIPLDPITKKNHSRIIYCKGRPMIIPSKQYVEFESECGKYLKPLQIDTPINLKCTFYKQARRRVDLPNLLNSICDVLTHYNVIEDDNCQIIASFNGSCVRYDKTNPRIEIEITEGVQSWEQKNQK